jgi:ATP/maltotriose-dependent transcriptional regulator MalT
MATVIVSRGQFDLAEGHCQRSLAYSKRLNVEGEDKTTSIFNALKIYSHLRQQQGNISDALTFAEDGYNLVVEFYDPVHLQVQEAAAILIHLSIAKGDYYNAGQFAEVTYSNLRDRKNGIDQESDDVATGAYNLANVIARQDDGDVTKAEGLARESLRI